MLKTASSALGLVKKVSVPSTNQFVVRNNFVENTNSNAAVKIGGLGMQFQKWFLGLTEDIIPKTTLCVYKLLRPSRDRLIIKELGGKAKARTTLQEVFALMRGQGRGERGILLVNGNRNVFYVRDQNRILRAVMIYFYNVLGGWRINAFSIQDEEGWREKNQVFSRPLRRILAKRAIMPS